MKPFLTILLKGGEGFIGGVPISGFFLSGQNKQGGCSSGVGSYVCMLLHTCRAYLSHVVGHVQVGLCVNTLYQTDDVACQVDILMYDSQMQGTAQGNMLETCERHVRDMWETCDAHTSFEHKHTHTCLHREK